MVLCLARFKLAKVFLFLLLSTLLAKSCWAFLVYVHLDDSGFLRYALHIVYKQREETKR